MTDTINYGVTWATPDHSIAQTGFVTTDEDEAIAMAIAGPWDQAEGVQVDPMCNDHELDGHKPFGPIFGLVQIEDGGSPVEVSVGGNVVRRSP